MSEKEIIGDDLALIDKCDENQLEFAIFCIENIASRLHLSSVCVYEALKESGILETYIIPSYDVLHTQSKDYIVDDIFRVLKLKGVVL